VDQKELELLINELETRIDRLRKLYEAYFLGFEKLEPTVPRKDVDRRFAELRKEQIRNTGLRFRLNMLTQRYNTYQTQWIRVCREIEEGTYKRHLQKAHARFDARGSKAPSKAPTKREHVEDSPSEIGLSFDTADLGELDEVFSVPPKPREEQLVAVTVKPTAIPSGMSHAPRPITMPGGKALPKLQLKAPGAPRIQEKDAPSDRPAAASILGIPGGAIVAPKIMERTDEKVPRTGDNASGRMTVRPGEEDEAAAIQIGAPSLRPGGPTSPSGAPGGVRPSIRPILRPAAAGGAPPGTPSRAPNPPSVASPHGAPTLVPRGASKAPAAPVDPEEKQMRALYNQYLDAKRARKESTAGVSYEAMSESVKRSAQQLKEKHAGKRVEFEVAEKDGKTILKPVLK